MKTASRFAAALVAAALALGAASAALAQASAAPPAKSLADLLDPVLDQARTRTVRILMGGTSISTFGFSGNQILASHLKALYGDARAEVQRAGYLAGSWDLPVQNWFKQPYSGPSFVRLRGDSASQPLELTGYASRIVVEYSREADGGLLQVTVDGSPAGTLNCAGPQQLSVQAVYPVPLGLHRVTFRPPGNGHVYLERVTFEQYRPGVEIIDGTLGGSGLFNVYTVYPRGGQTVPGIPTQPGVGVRSYFGRPDIDLVIWSGPVNDFGGNESDFTTWSARMDEVVEATGSKNMGISLISSSSPTLIRADRAHGLKTGDVVTITGSTSRPSIDGVHAVTVTSPLTFTVPVAVTGPGRGGSVTRASRPLLLIAEMGGHFLMPTDPHYADYLAKVEYLRKLGRENAHVMTIDWQGATADSDIVRYAANYYGLDGPVTVNPATGEYTGDFIHPNAAAHRVSLDLLCQSLGIPVPPEATCADVDNRIRKTSPLKEGTPIQFGDGKVSRRGVASPFGASVFSGLSCIATLPLIFSEETTNLTDWNQRIAASPTSDRFGKYIDYPQDLPIALFNQNLEGQRVTVTALMRPNPDAGWMRLMSPGLAPGTMYYKNSVLESWLSFFYNPEECPMWVTFEYVPGAQQELYVNGRLYSISITRTAGQPVSTERRLFPVAADLHTAAASQVTKTTATLNSAVRSGGNGTLSVSFDYGLDQNLQNTSGSAILPDDGLVTGVEQTLTGLTPATTYYYRVRATGAGNPITAVGETLSFRTR